jgi:RNA polymerase sigma factor (TIGR02999 family)
MVDEQRDAVSEIIARMGDGGADPRAIADELVPHLYRELRRLARWQMARGTPGVTLQPTALVHEAYIRLADRAEGEWRSRTHFIAVASKVMRHLLVDHARAKAAAKRGAGWQPVTLVDGVVGSRQLDVDELLALEEAMGRLAEHDERQARLVEMRFFGGLKVREAAEVLGVSQRTAEGLWTHARAWLLRELQPEAGG